MNRTRVLTLRSARSALVMLAVIGPASPAAAQQSAAANAASMKVSDPWNAVVMDFVVSRRTVGRDGQPVGIGNQTATYHLDVSAAPLGWRTHLTISPGTQQRVRWDGTTVQDDPIGAIRVEDDGDGSPLRLYDRLGHQIHMPSDDVLAQLGHAAPPLGQVTTKSFASEPVRPANFGREWVMQMIATLPDRGHRLKALERAFGKPGGQVGGLDRYLKQEPGRMVEVLADPETGVVRETRIDADNTRILTITTDYRKAADGSLIKNATHVEQALDGAQPATAIADLTVQNIRFERR